MKFNELGKEIISNCLEDYGIHPEIIDNILSDLDAGINQVYSMENDVPSANLKAYNERQENEKYKKLEREIEITATNWKEKYDEMLRDRNYVISMLQEALKEAKLNQK